MIKAILFDLDGTLLPMSTEEFLEHYLKLLGNFVASRVNPKKFLKQIIDSTAAMVSNIDPNKTNQQVFMEDFFTKTGLDSSEWMPLFDKFYNDVFPSLEKVVQKNSLSRKIIEKACELGYELVIATNPVFPEIAIVERMRWAGIDDFRYRLVTSYERMHYCKPQVQYYEEVLQIINRGPSECLMVGNDAAEDLAAGAVGIKTFLVDHYLIERDGFAIDPDYRGSLGDLMNLMNTGFVPKSS